MAKLHELLAVDSNLDGQATKCRNELVATFTNKRHLFQEKLVTYQSKEDGVPPVTESQSAIQTSMKKELEWIGKILIKAIDCGHQIDVANTLAKADITDEDGAVLLKDVPTTSLLQLGHRLQEIHDLVSAIPTLDPAKGFTQDATREAGVFKAHDVRKDRTKKVFVPLVLAAATKEHPAQVKEGFEDKPIGTVLEQEWSALITPARKADLIDNCEKLIRAVKSARARANEFELKQSDHKIGRALWNFVMQETPEE